MIASKESRPEGLDFDDFAWKLASRILEDLKPFADEMFHKTACEAVASRNVVQLRALTCGRKDSDPPYQVKVHEQILNLFKKFSFSQDLYTPDELRNLSKKKFMDNQVRLLNFSVDLEDPLVRDILFSAKGYVDQILGDFSHLEICERATFGKKSSVGIPMRKACEGERYEAPITGSDDLIDWFSNYFGRWNRPAYAYAELRAKLHSAAPFKSIDVLEAVLVNKTWKSLRMIMPNTTLGSLYSSGLGKVIEDRLRSFGYDIKHLQPVHGELARIGSITGSLVTGDQSMASDNITTQLIDLMFPFRWARALKFGRIADLSLYGDRVTTPTFSTMGIGFTFPLQTLVFLSLLLGIRDHCKLDEQTVISVFGDDLVYDYRMHSMVMEVFPKFGLVMNPEKTFSEGWFRESCGHDYFRGVDVRPFLLGRSPKSAGKRRSEAYLYKALNGLLLRWEVYELPSTFAFVVEEIRRVRREEPLLVPLDFPDTAGAKLTSDSAYLLGINRKIKKNVHGTYSFRYLAFEPDLREERRELPYLLQRLRTHPGVVNLPFPKRGVGELIIESPQMLTRLRANDPRCSPKLPKEKRKRPHFGHIPEQDMGRFRERSGVSVNWTPGRN